LILQNRKASFSWCILGTWDIARLFVGDVSIVGKVKSLSLNHRFVIALHSPREIDETGLPQSPREKDLKARQGNTAEHFLRSGLRTTIAELRGFAAIFRGM
jgi:hypothetical protein